MLFHASSHFGLTALAPHVSTGRTAYVYAIRDKTAAVCFGAPKDDFDLLMDVEDGITVLCECYPGALEKVYAGKTCALYTVDERTFRGGCTGWDAEYVSEAEVPVLSEEIIPDILAYLLQEAERGSCIIRRYAEEETYLSMLRDELRERIDAFGLTKAQMERDCRFRLYFNKLLDPQDSAE